MQKPILKLFIAALILTGCKTASPPKTLTSHADRTTATWHMGDCIHLPQQSPNHDSLAADAETFNEAPKEPEFTPEEEAAWLELLNEMEVAPPEKCFPYQQFDSVVYVTLTDWKPATALSGHEHRVISSRVRICPSKAQMFMGFLVSGQNDAAGECRNEKPDRMMLWFRNGKEIASVGFLCGGTHLRAIPYHHVQNVIALSTKEQLMLSNLELGRRSKSAQR